MSANEEGFAAREVAGAKRARDALRLIGFPSVKDFKGMVRGNILNRTLKIGSPFMDLTLPP